MTLRTVLIASATCVFVLLLTLAAAVSDAPSVLTRTATEWATTKSLLGSFSHDATDARVAQPVTCNDDAALLAICKAPMAQPLQPAHPAILESPAIMQPAVIAGNPSAIDAGPPTSRCLAFIDANETNDDETDAAAPAGSCCGKSEHLAPGTGRAASGASGCACDPQECKCA